MSTDNPYAAPQSVVEDRDLPELSLASRGARLVAFVLDGFFALILIYGVPILLGGGSVLFADDADIHLGSEEAMVLALVGLSVGGILLFVINLILLRKGQTVGKKVVGVRIVRSDGSRASLGRIVLLRMILNNLLMWTGIYFLIDSAFIFREDRRCLHDLIADTTVVTA